MKIHLNFLYSSYKWMLIIFFVFVEITVVINYFKSGDNDLIILIFILLLISLISGMLFQKLIYRLWIENGIIYVGGFFYGKITLDRSELTIKKNIRNFNLGFVQLELSESSKKKKYKVITNNKGVGKLRKAGFQIM